MTIRVRKEGEFMRAALFIADGPVGATAWHTDVPAARDSPLAKAFRHRELARPLHPGRATGRAVVLRYTDGAHLVVVSPDGEEPSSVAARLLGHPPVPVTEDLAEAVPGIRVQVPCAAPVDVMRAAVDVVAARFGGAVPTGFVPAAPAGHLAFQRVPHPLTLEPTPDGLRLWAGDGGPAEWWLRSFAEEFVRVVTGDADPQDARTSASPAVDRADLINRRFLAVARRQPDAVAVVDGSRRTTYRELDERSDRGAAALAALGVRRGTLVGLRLDRSTDLVVGMLSVLKAGGTYVPFDVTHPEARTDKVIADSGLEVVVTDPAQFTTGSVADPDTATVDTPAYVIYTSGSTGEPKGVVVPHRNLVALIDATRDEYGLGPEDTWSWFHSAAFDFSVWEIWGCLLTGGRLVVVPKWTARSPEDFLDLLDTEGVTVLNQTPSAFTHLLEAQADGRRDLAVRLLVFGGEALDTRVLRRWFDLCPGCRVVNMFGITETTVHVTARTVTRADALTGTRSVGRPLPGWAVRVVGADGRVLPYGALGEIEVSGVGVADGYLGRPDLTVERFRREGGIVWYRSGDLGMLRPDGELEHHGRIDRQIKIRGHRVEVGEVEAALAECQGVSAAAVVYRLAVPGDTATGRLDGYVVVTPGTDTAAIRVQLHRRLPEHMVPATVTAVAQLPLTSNGKLDAAALPVPSLTGAATAGKAAAGTEGVVLSALAEILGLADVGLDDNFFDLGGNSILAARTAALLRARGLTTLTVKSFYLNQTPRALAAFVDTTR